MNEALSIEERIRIQGVGLLEAIPRSAGPARLAWLDALLKRAIADPQFRVQALRFIDVLPALQDDAALVAHLKEYFSDLELPWPALSNWSLKHSDSHWAVHIAAPLVRATLRGLSRRFMGGSHVQHALETIARLRSQGMKYTLDMLGEAVVSEREADDYQQAYIDLLKGLWHSSNDDNQRLRPNVSLKLSSLYSQISPLDPAGSVAAITGRLRPILRTAIACDACVTVDMEQYDFRHIVMQCFMQLLMEPEFRDWPHAGIVVQAYLRDARDDLQWLIDWAEERATPILVRLVRGAYWDSETVIARQHGWELPVWEHKGETDANFESCLDLLLASHRSIRPAVATHNVRSLACAMVMAEQHGLASEDFEFQMLYGMADELKQALVELGWSLRIYVPFGETLPGMAYLVRRLLENTSGQTILDAGMPGTGLDESCLERPVPWIARVGKQPVRHFRNLPVHRFVGTDERTGFAEAIAAAREDLGQVYPLLINGATIVGSGEIVSTNPAHPDEVIGTVVAAGQAEADRALEAARTAFPDWAGRPAAERADCLRRIAALLTGQRDRFAAWQVLEAGKTWREADADVCEAVDFLNYYAWRAERLAAARVRDLSGEHNTWSWRPRGVGVVISPWNFPLAILTGMLSATIVSGNTAILKPSSLTPVIALRFMTLLQEAGLPPGVVNCLPGNGSEVGAHLANSPAVHIIAFTGSREVGTQLLREGARVAHGQEHIKRVIAEMGGKNAIIIDDDANLDDAVPGVVQSAFGYQGQKCSAASRVIVVGGIYESFLERLLEATASLVIGDPQHPGTRLGPVIDALACERIRSTIARGKQAGELISRVREDLPAQGHFLSPAIFTGVDPVDPLAQEEIFGPVLTVLRAEDFETALALANGTQYALTGGVYSRRPAHLVRAREGFQVGNLYINRHITGSLVSRQPFGGFRMSGVGSKAGGPDYLKQFMDPVCVTENTLRRGFAPDVDADPA
ncbi:MAG: proline dehydrogenase family protein [Gammaproteobacteria bacterium]|jgi:RHH-type proline utilization regulon transcriptional repressor/proline dehydrogenase/delta 1-pyrroline-5-carboxylate dehydrogenase